MFFKKKKKLAAMPDQTDYTDFFEHTEEDGTEVVRRTYRDGKEELLRYKKGQDGNTYMVEREALPGRPLFIHDSDQMAQSVEQHEGVPEAMRQCLDRLKACTGYKKASYDILLGIEITQLIKLTGWEYVTVLKYLAAQDLLGRGV